MAKSKTQKTKAPTGLAIKRNKGKFTLTWKIADADYKDGQYFSQLIDDTGNDKWTKAKKIGTKQTSKAISVNLNSYYPKKKRKLHKIGMRVKGNRAAYTTGSGSKKVNHKPGMSAWSAKSFTINLPRNPSVTATLDSELTNVCRFSWSVTTKNDDSHIFTDVEWQTILVKNNAEKKGSKLAKLFNKNQIGWDTGTSASASNSKTITEDTAILYQDGNSYVRWFRIRSRGPRGASEWKYTSHTYALSKQANVYEVSASETEEGGFVCVIKWEVGSNKQNPIDKTTAQYTIVIPDEGLACPSGASWTDANISKDTSSDDAAVFSIDDQVSKDQCLFVRVNTQHDSNITYGKPQLAYVGFLKDPSDITVQTDNVTHNATISAQNNSEVEDSVLAVRYVPADGDPFVVGIITSGGSTTVHCPDWSQQRAIAFEVFAFVGTYEKQERADNVDEYSVDALMISENTIKDGGEVPSAPSAVQVSRTAIAGTVRVTWDWSWANANGAQLSWSDHADAWESTDEPEMYTISRLHASQWNISGLETGITWYVRVRLISSSGEDDDSITYGPWSSIEQGAIDLSSAPNKPTLLLSDTIIPEDGSTTASWVYTTTDNTEQAYAEIAVVNSTSGSDVYDVGTDESVQVTETNVSVDGFTPVAHTQTAQHVTIDAETAGWTVGNSYNLVCRVMSASGLQSEWSDPVTVTIAEPIVATISESSLVDAELPVNPRSFNGDVVSFSSDVEEIFTKLKVEMEPIQDLHGYDHPWVGGAGANKWDEVWELGWISSTGENRDSSEIIRSKNYIPVTPNTTYCIVVPASTDIVYFDDSKVAIGNTDKNGIGDTDRTVNTRTTHDNCHYIRFWTRNQTTYNHDIAINYPSTVTTYSPYENICPISGWDSVEAVKAGKNLWGGEKLADDILSIVPNSTKDTTAHTVTFTSRDVSNKTIVDKVFKANTQYTFIFKEVDGSNAINFAIVYTDGSYHYFPRGGSGIITSTAGKTVKSLMGVWASGTTILDYDRSGIFEGVVTEDQYEPYQGTTHTATFEETVYGGDYDFISGDGQSEMAKVDVSSVQGKTENENGYFWYTTASALSISPISRLNAKLISDRFVAKSNTTVTDDDGSITFYANGIIRWKEKGDLTLADYRAYLASNPFQLAYELATPRTIQLTPQAITTLVGENNVWADSGEVRVSIAEDLRQGKALTEMPLTVTVSGAGEGGMTSLVIERNGSYHIDGPEENDFNGYDRETIVSMSQTGDDQMEISTGLLVGELNDGAGYRIVATVHDGIGQVATVEQEFDVMWEHQALIPSAEVVIDEENLIAKIKPIAPTGALDTDVADIYRLSADKPELIVQGATFGETYVDPYPALGDMGGHRIVLRTENNDYITADNEMAWVDSPELGVNPIENEETYTIINFDDKEIRFYFDTDYSSQWAKDFQETQYLGGHIQGDWNPAVSRTGTIGTLAISTLDQEMLRAVRRLAVYPGICHVRTPDGSSYAADVQVSEDRVHDDQEMLVTYSLSITKVDTESLDGILLSQWEEENGEA